MISAIEIRPSAKAATWKTIRWVQGTRKQIVLRIIDEDGEPVDLTAEPVTPGAPKETFGYEAPVTPGTVGVRLVVVNEIWGPGGSQLLMDLEGTVLTSCEGIKDCQDYRGLVTFTLESGIQVVSGIYKAQISRFVSGGYQVDAYPAYLSIEPNLTNPWMPSGLPTIPEIRLALGDSAQGEVNLLDDFEFEDTEIAAAMRWVVDRWNNTPPPVCMYSYANFPYRYWWIRGTMIQLLNIAVKRYARNRLPYQAGGVTIDDQNKAAEYQGIADREFKEFEEWFKMEKRRQNYGRAWSSNRLGS